MELQIIHGQSDNVPGNSYVVKGSGFAASGHPKYLRIVPGLAPKAEQHKISLAERKVLRPRAAIVENVLVQERIKLI